MTAAGYWPLAVAARLVRLPPARVRRYLRAGLVLPARMEGRQALFGEEELARLRKIRRLSDDLGLSPPALEVVLHLIDELETLRAGAELRQPSGLP